MRCSMGPGREVPPLDDIGVVWKTLPHAARQLVLQREKEMGTKNWHEMCVEQHAKSTHRSRVSTESYSGILGSLKAS
jgi:hypothetical protein